MQSLADKFNRNASSNGVANHAAQACGFCAMHITHYNELVIQYYTEAKAQFGSQLALNP
jgi:hypothetical protein